MYEHLGAAPPHGYIERLTKEAIITGWAYDPADPGKSIDIHIYQGGKAGEGGQFIASGPANIPRPDVNRTMQIPGDHAYAVAMPPDKVRGEIYVYGVNGDRHAVLMWAPGYTSDFVPPAPVYYAKPLILPTDQPPADQPPAELDAETAKAKAETAFFLDPKFLIPAGLVYLFILWRAAR